MDGSREDAEVNSNRFFLLPKYRPSVEDKLMVGESIEVRAEKLADTIYIDILYWYMGIEE